MTTDRVHPSDAGLAALKQGLVIPAHPLALDEDRTLDRTRQRALTRYYLDCGVGGLAVGVHTTQFAIREHGLYEPVLRLAAETAADWTGRPVALVAGVTGRTDEALNEARIARSLGYHAVLVNVAAFRDAGEPAALDHIRSIAAIMPVIGFALAPDVGGYHLSYDFWRSFVRLPNVVAIKIATFNRYRTSDIVRAVVDAGVEDQITLYTGNDDHIVLDLLAPFAMRRSSGRPVRVRISGGLLGHWSVWTRRAVDLMDKVRERTAAADVPADLLSLDSVVTDCNSAIYDAGNGFRGSIPGCLEVLRRQGLVRGTWCLDHTMQLSPGQSTEIDRVHRMYPEANDDDFVRANLHRWLSDAGRSVPLVA